ncbi:actin-related protein 6 [Episyrphus balteatus]|uniref:actin-related protein 6 n=1 Tax=Episyrphus balteatus TaxID=286459 RepID=UPI002485208B|nr:actin-related protein 6 [Episyrphus balteatus]
MPIVVLDNGGYAAKVGLASDNKPTIIPNCIMKVKSERRRAFIGRQIETCIDTSGLFYMLCFQKGLLVNWDAQKTIWDYIFSSDCTNIKLSNNTLIVTEPLFNPLSIQEVMTEILFEEFDCGAIARTPTSDLAAYNYFADNNCSGNCIIIDVGYSFTHVVPYIKGKRVKNAIKRIDVGGKVLTNYLKELVSYRYLNMMDETYVVNQIKEDVCFVAENFVQTMTESSKSVEANFKNKVEYILPDFTTFKRGFINNNSSNATGQQSINICNERFVIPELLFNPCDVGINQMGIPETVLDALKDCPECSHAALLKNIIVIGGSCLFPGFLTRLQKDLEKLAPDYYDIQVTIPKDPMSYGWKGGKNFANSPEFEKVVFQRSEFEENGFQYSYSKFDL